MATYSPSSTSFEIDPVAAGENVVDLSGVLSKTDARGIVATIQVTGSVRCNAQGNGADGRATSSETLYLTLFTNKFRVFGVNGTDSIKVDL